MTLERDSILRFPTQLCAITLALTLASFGWVVWNAYSSYRDAGTSVSLDLRVEELRGVILHLDEVLTMSARMAAVTGDLRWETRYRQFEPKLDAAIKETMALAPGDAPIVGATQTGVAKAKLVVMENQAIALVHDGRFEDARAVLFGPIYEEQKAIYAGGMTALLTDVQARVDSTVRRAKRQALLSMAGSSVLLGLSIAACKTAVDAGDSKRIRTTAHALKGAAGNVSAVGLAEAAGILERIGAEDRVNTAQAGWRRLSVEAAKALGALRQLDETLAREAPALTTTT
jgi:HPt (histidine-containing phosphotransfer) domain-containing protein